MAVRMKSRPRTDSEATTTVLGLSPAGYWKLADGTGAGTAAALAGSAGTYVGTPTLNAAGRVQAWVIGPGFGTGHAESATLRAVLATDLPVLVDADALTLPFADAATRELPLPRLLRLALTEPRFDTEPVERVRQCLIDRLFEDHGRFRRCSCSQRTGGRRIDGACEAQWSAVVVRRLPTLLFAE